MSAPRGRVLRGRAPRAARQLRAATGRRRPFVPRTSNLNVPTLALTLVQCPKELRVGVRRAVREALCTVFELRREPRPIKRCEVSIALVTDPEIAELNERWLGHRGPTDVLTFDLRDEPDPRQIIGEIIISLDTARREAARRGHAWRHEVLLYIVHGLLHLLGYDDARAKHRAEMHAIEDKVLSALGIGPVYARDRGAPRTQATRFARRSPVPSPR